MSLYQKIKSAITVRQVGEMYGMEPDRHGMVCCPFHSDSDPSMKLNDNYYYCFGCGANGDAIDLTAKLFDLNPRQAAEKLASDFGLDPDKPPANAIALPPPMAHFARARRSVRSSSISRYDPDSSCAAASAFCWGVPNATQSVRCSMVSVVWRASSNRGSCGSSGVAGL